MKKRSLGERFVVLREAGRRQSRAIALAHSGTRAGPL